MTARGPALLGQRLQAVAPRRDQREFRADEERVGADQQDRRQQLRTASPISGLARTPESARSGSSVSSSRSIRRPSIRRTLACHAASVWKTVVSYPPVSCTVVADARECGRAAAAPARRSSRIALGGAVAGRGGHLVDAQQARNPPAAAGGHHIRCRVVVLVADVADDLFDQVLDGHHARGAAVLVDDHRGLQAVGADLGHHRVAVERGRHRRDRLGDVVDQRGPRSAGGTSNTCLTCTMPTVSSRSPSTIGKRENPDSAAAGDQVGDGVVGLQRHDLGPRGHQLLGGQVAELQRSVAPAPRWRGPGAAARRGAHQRQQLLRGAGRPQLLGRLDAQLAHDPVRRAVGQPDRRR